MKKIIKKPVRERAKYFCDKHKDRECYTTVKTICWYGSKFDLNNLDMNLCDECMERFYKYIKKTFGVEPIDRDILIN